MKHYLVKCKLKKIKMHKEPVYSAMKTRRLQFLNGDVAPKNIEIVYSKYGNTRVYILEGLNILG